MEQEQEDRLSRVEQMTLRMSVIQTVLAVTGFCVAIIALYAALNEADAVRKQQQASVWPHVELRQSFRNLRAERLELSLRNSGIGPAKIGSIEFFLGGEALSNWEQAIQLVTETESNTFSYESVSGRVIRPDQDIVILSLLAEEMPIVAIAQVQAALDSGHLTSRVCYCSVFDECWVLESDSRSPVPVRECSVANDKITF